MGENGYAWWYVDALSSDGAHGLTIIAFVGSVFSPYYAFARARGRGDPENHVCLNIALDGAPKRWAMTERGRNSLRRSTEEIVVGASAMRWDGGRLVIDIDEPTVPLPGRIRGRVEILPKVRGDRAFTLDRGGRHRWCPIAPLCDVLVTLEEPGLSWTGTSYFDTNNGDEPLEAAFRSWTWTRFETERGAAIVYDVIERDGTIRPLALTVTDRGVTSMSAPAAHALPRTAWGIERHVPGDTSTAPRIRRAMVDAPFYARTAIASTIEGEACLGVSESLSLTRVAHPIVRAMLPFKMFRRTAAAHRRMR